MDPSGDGKATLRIARDGLLKHYERTGNSSTYLDGLLLPEALQAPIAVVEGLNRPGQERKFCYCGVPTGRFHKDEHVHLPPPPGKTYLAFVTEDLKVVKWGWSDEDPERPGFPMGYQTRFGRRT